jgi:hypothetical protein
MLNFLFFFELPSQIEYVEKKGTKYHSLFNKKRQNATLIKSDSKDCDFLSFFWSTSFMEKGVHVFLPFCGESFEH